MKKFWAKKVIKKMKGGGMSGRLEKEFTEDAKLGNGGYIMEDVLKKENYPKKAEGGYIKKDREELKSEIKGMGPEGKAYLRDELKGKKYEGKLKGKYKGDLNKELYGMHKKGKEYLKDLVRKSVKREGEAVKDPIKRKGIRREGEKPSLGKIIESKSLKFKLREGEGIPKKDIVKKAKGGWIQGAVKKPGALRAVAAKEGLIKGKEKLSSSDLSKLGSQAKKSGNSLLAKRVSLAKTFSKMRKKK